MFRIDDPTAAVALPTPAAAGTGGYFTEGDPGAGVAATRVTGDFLNMLQEELANAVTGTGGTLSKTTYTQLRDAIKGSGTMASTGYRKTPSGLIFQWGYMNSAPSTGSITFPVSFPGGTTYIVLFSPVELDTTAALSVNGFSYTASQFSYTKSASTSKFAWFAVGS